MPYKDPEKRRQYAAQHYLDNKPDYAARRNRKRRINREKINALKEASPCVDCGQSYPYYVMQYDHIGTDKVASIADLLRGRSLSAVESEIAKCELVCANCHAVRTHNRRLRIM